MTDANLSVVVTLRTRIDYAGWLGAALWVTATVGGASLQTFALRLFGRGVLLYCQDRRRWDIEVY